MNRQTSRQTSDNPSQSVAPRRVMQIPQSTNGPAGTTPNKRSPILPSGQSLDALSGTSSLLTRIYYHCLNTSEIPFAASGLYMFLRVHGPVVPFCANLRRDIGKSTDAGACSLGVCLVSAECRGLAEGACSDREQYRNIFFAGINLWGTHAKGLKNRTRWRIF